MPGFEIFDDCGWDNDEPWESFDELPKTVWDWVDKADGETLYKMFGDLTICAIGEQVMEDPSALITSSCPELQNWSAYTGPPATDEQLFEQFGYSLSTSSSESDFFLSSDDESVVLMP